MEISIKLRIAQKQSWNHMYNIWDLPGGEGANNWER